MARRSRWLPVTIGLALVVLAAAWAVVGTMLVIYRLGAEDGFVRFGGVYAMTSVLLVVADGVMTGFSARGKQSTWLDVWKVFYYAAQTATVLTYLTLALTSMGSSS